MTAGSCWPTQRGTSSASLRIAAPEQIPRAHGSCRPAPWQQVRVGGKSRSPLLTHLGATASQLRSHEPLLQVGCPAPSIASSLWPHERRLRRTRTQPSVAEGRSRVAPSSARRRAMIQGYRSDRCQNRKRVRPRLRRGISCALPQHRNRFFITAIAGDRIFSLFGCGERGHQSLLEVDRFTAVPPTSGDSSTSWRRWHRCLPGTRHLFVAPRPLPVLRAFSGCHRHIRGCRLPCQTKPWSESSCG